MLRPGDEAGPALLAALMGAADVLVGVFELLEDDYRYTFANENTAAYHGCTHAELVGRTAKELGIAPARVARRLEVLRECWNSKSTVTMEYPFELHGRSTAWFLGAFQAIAGSTPRVSFVLIDITARKEAQLAAQKTSSRLEAALDATGLGLWEFDIANDVVFWDERTRALFGVTPDAQIDFATYQNLLHPDDAPLVAERYTAAIEGVDGGKYSVEHRVLVGRDRPTWVRGSGQVIFDAAGGPTHVLGAVLDITAEVEAREHQSLLMAELNHRVKNNLATVQSLAVQTAKRSPDIPTFLPKFEGRVVAMARTHDVLTQNAWAGAELRVLLERELASVIERVSLTGPRVELTASQALALGLLTHELATNAMKYGALSQVGGHVAIDWAPDGGDVAFRWTEQGGPPVTPPTREGFGSRLMARMAHGELRGQISISHDPEGLSLALRFPIVTPKA